MQVTYVYMYESAIGQSYMIETKITSITQINRSVPQKAMLVVTSTDPLGRTLPEETVEWTE